MAGNNIKREGERGKKKEREGEMTDKTVCSRTVEAGAHSQLNAFDSIVKGFGCSIYCAE